MEFHAAVEYTKADIKIYQRFHRKTKRRAFNIVLTVLFMLAAILLAPVIVIDIRNGSIGDMITRTAVFALLIALYFLRDSINAAAMLRRRVKGTEHMEYVFDDECFKVDCGALKEQYDYAALKELYRVKGIFLMYVDKLHAVILPERCFTLGTPDAFARFISEKTGREVINKK